MILVAINKQLVTFALKQPDYRGHANKIRTIITSFCLFLAVSGAISCSRHELPRIVTKYDPREGYVPDQNTAIAVTEAISVPFYGRELVEAERPYKAVLNGDVWTVKGTLPRGDQIVGGTLTVQISKKDGRIVAMTHGQ